MTLEDARKSRVIMTGGQKVEALREALNSAYSQAPSELDGVFTSALDVVADQQVAITQALVRLIEEGATAEAETKISAALASAEGVALRAARAYADFEFSEAGKVYHRLTQIPTNTSELVRRKLVLDGKFKVAVQLHDANDGSALEMLLPVAAGFREWCSEAEIAITGSTGLVLSDRRRQRLQILAIIVALLLGAISIILNILRN